MFKRVLIANRGEIAVRIIRACREMGIESVVVFSDVDRRALHVRKADYAYHIGSASAQESYLNIGKILSVAKISGAEAVHPGYGFLSESATFARACAGEGLKFIGPSAAAMEMMGSKTSARRAMSAANIPLVPGSTHGLQSLEEAERVSSEIGFPVMLKAASGGGGKGMRLVRDARELQPALSAARSEAQRAFGDDEIYIEKFVERPRHIEVQILADEHGNIIYLGERECSVQRRHQKVLEESPSSVVDPEMRQRMGQVAVQVARTANYTNAGTVEFLVDADRNFYFLEMNTRLQVEHPVTEIVTGLDLVQLQFRIAAGERLQLTQADIQIRGHAIECRVYAEDPDNNFFPSPGQITRLISPSGPGIRRDSGMYEGWTVPLEYDPLLAKLIGYGTTREDAIRRLQRALSEYFVGGIKTNISLFRRILADPDFQQGRIDTTFLDQLLQKTDDQPGIEDESIRVAAIAAGIFAATETRQDSGVSGEVGSDGRRSTSASNWKKAARSEASGV